MNTDEKILEDILACADAAARRCFPELLIRENKGRRPYPYVNDNGEPIPLVDVEGTSTAMQRALDPSKVQTSNAVRAATRQIYSEKILQVEDYLAARLIDVAAAQIDLAVGHKIAVKDPKTGEIVEIYEQGPDSRTGISILDRFLGRPVQRQEIQSDIRSQQSVLVYIPDNGRTRDQSAKDDRARVNYGPIIDLPVETTSTPEGETREPTPEEHTIVYNLPTKRPLPTPVSPEKSSTQLYDGIEGRMANA